MSKIRIGVIDYDVSDFVIVKKKTNGGAIDYTLQDLNVPTYLLETHEMRMVRDLKKGTKVYNRMGRELGVVC